MAATPTPTAEDYLYLKSEFDKLKLLLPQPGNPGGSSSPLTRSEIVIQNFNKDPIGIHYAANPAKTKLACDGFNFKIWEKELNCTLRQIFQVKDFSILQSNFTAQLLDEQDSIARLIRSTINEDLLGIVDSTDNEDPWSIFELLKAKCSRSDCRHKLSLVEQIIALATDKTPGSKVNLAKWSCVMAEIKQFNITVDELGGLFLQSSFVAPIGVDLKTFEFSVDQNLEQKDKPSFSYVTTIIQSASSKAKNKVPTPSDGYAPMDLDAINAIKTTRPLYSAPHRRPPPVLKQEHPKTSLSIDKAQRFRGKPLNEVLKNWYGDACHYCKQVGHWYNNCAAFWDDVDKKVIDPPPRDYNTPESNYLPPHQPPYPQNRLRQLEIPEVDDGKVLS
ncbi:Dcp1p-Dcp2p decapping enzyme complex alpha subunit [Puccinia graminis f. sp. tritici]|uniref:Dcp1p-Dcp2p decapping enzyme complex alpha subunit n=1 Tax=Puccinia graminis f. sp. tritici TaxID=56615 RepID=A0A5B0LH05_PUCGR|nr:Dcp1p-Dcp2p decapping enzyme complex alpha subunit [Puccinia graminis f. sp. tritici]